MNKKIKVFNVIFPIWILFVFPPILLFVLPSNFLIDSIIILLLLKIFKLELKTNYKETIIKIWLFGFASDIIGALLLFLTQILPDSLYSITRAVAWDPYSNIFGFLIVFLAVIISGLFIYIFNYKFTLKNIKTTKKIKQKIALLLALLTAPYMFLIPTKLFYNNSFKENRTINYNISFLYKSDNVKLNI